MKNKTNKVMKDNKLIAEFMGYRECPQKLFRMDDEFQSVTIYAEYQEQDEYLTIEAGKRQIKYTPNEMEFHISWDWLMPVVDKIESFEDKNRCAKYNVNMLQCWVEIINNDTSEEIVEAEGINKLQATYHAVVEFIKHINK